MESHAFLIGGGDLQHRQSGGSHDLAGDVQAPAAECRGVPRHGVNRLVTTAYAVVVRNAPGCVHVLLEHLVYQFIPGTQMVGVDDQLRRDCLVDTADSAEERCGYVPVCSQLGIDDRLRPGKLEHILTIIIGDILVDFAAHDKGYVQPVACARSARATGLPVWLGLSAEHSAAGTLTFHGSEIPFAEGVQQILAESWSLQAVGVMYSERAITLETLEVLATLWDGPLFAYPHHGVFEMPYWRFDNTLTPDEFADAATDWVNRGTGAVSGCCGIRPAHIAALK